MALYRIGSPPADDHSLKEAAAAPTVYFVLALETRWIKIGYSRFVPQRMRALQQAQPATLRLLALLSGDRDKERALHRRFAPWRLRGEWYNDAPPLRAYMAAHALAPAQYYELLCPQWCGRLLRAYADVFGPDVGRLANETIFLLDN